MIAHHASAIGMAHSAMDKLSDADLKAMADNMFAKQATEIAELQRLRDSIKPANR